MRGLWRRARVLIARLMARGTGCRVVRANVVDEVCALADALRSYAEHSGGLNDPRRIEAQRVIFRKAEALYWLSRSLAVPE